MNPGVMTAPQGAANTPATVSNNTAVANVPGGAAPAAPGTGTGLSPWSTKGMSDSFANVINQPSVRKVLPLIVMLVVLVVFGLIYAWMNVNPPPPRDARSARGRSAKSF